MTLGPIHRAQREACNWGWVSKEDPQTTSYPQLNLAEPLSGCMCTFAHAHVTHMQGVYKVWVDDIVCVVHQYCGSAAHTVATQPMHLGVVGVVPVSLADITPLIKSGLLWTELPGCVVG